MTQTDARKRQLLQQMDETRASTEVALSGIDRFCVIYAESGWRVKDLMAHLAAWENQVATSIEAYSGGAKYTIPDFTTDDVYNEWVFQQNWDTPIKQIQANWSGARERLKRAIDSIPDERFDGQIMCPWKLYSAIDGIVSDMINHEAEHLHDILTRVD